MFNSPALFGSFLNIVNLAFLWSIFREGSVGILERKSNRRKQRIGPSCPNGEQSGLVKLPPPDNVAIWLCYLLRFTQQFVITNLETIGSSFAMLMFLWTPRQVVIYEAIAHSARGMVALLVYIAYIAFDLGNIVNDRLVCLASLGALLLFHIFTFSWPFLPNPVPMAVNSTNPSSPSSLSDSLGCDPKLRDWCGDLRQVDVLVYYSLMISMIGLAFPLINVSMNTIFSKVIGPRLQAKQQGMLQMCGGTGRMAGPLLIGFLYALYGPRLVWIIECAVILGAAILWAIFYRRLVPLELPEGIRRISTVSSAVDQIEIGDKKGRTNE